MCVKIKERNRSKIRFLSLFIIYYIQADSGKLEKAGGLCTGYRFLWIKLDTCDAHGDNHACDLMSIICILRLWLLLPAGQLEQ